MSDKNRSLNDCDIQSYVDGEMDQTQRSEVDQVLARCRASAARAEDYLRINEALRGLHAEVLDEPVPDRFLNHRSNRSRPPWLGVAAAVAASLFLGAFGGWLVRGIGEDPHALAAELLEYSFSAHAAYAPEVRHPVEVAAAQEQHLVAWLSKRLGANIRAPKLGELGFELLGGRLLPAEGTPSAQFMYQNPNGRRLTLYVRYGGADNNLSAFRFAEAEGMRAF